MAHTDQLVYRLEIFVKDVSTNVKINAVGVLCCSSGIGERYQNSLFYCSRTNSRIRKLNYTYIYGMFLKDVNLPGCKLLQMLTATSYAFLLFNKYETSTFNPLDN